MPVVMGPGLRRDDVCRRSPQRLQPRLDLSAARLQERRQRQLLAERLDRLVGGKARTVGRDFEQDAVRLAEIKAAEIEAVDLARVRNTCFAQAPRPGMILRLVRRAE